MRALWAVTKKELYSYLVSPMAYVVAAVFLLINGLIFYVFIAGPMAEASIQPVLPSLAFILLLIMPILTMRLIAEERGSGTMELLMTLPITDTQVVLGKFIATVLAYTLILAPTLTYVVILNLFGTPEWGLLLSAYLGLILLGGSYIAVGMLASSLATTQMVAGVLSFGALLLLWLLGALGQLAAGPLGTVLGLLSFLSPTAHFDTFGRGLLDTQHIIFYLTFIAGTVFLTIRTVESSRWR